MKSLVLIMALFAMIFTLTPVAEAGYGGGFAARRAARFQARQEFRQDLRAARRAPRAARPGITFSFTIR